MIPSCPVARLFSPRHFIAGAALALSSVAGVVPTRASSPVSVAVWQNPAEDGVVAYRIPQILVTQSGTLIAGSEARFQKGDGSKVDIVIRRSHDRGETWSKSQFLDRSKGAENYVFPLFLQDRDTHRIFYFCSLRDEGLNDRTTESFYRTSDDDGATWSDRVEVTATLASADRALQQAIKNHAAPREFAGENPELFGRELFFFGPGRPIQLSRNHRQFPGRLVIPVFLIKDRRISPRSLRGYGDAVLVSDDHGRTWQCGGIVPLGEAGSSEVDVAELDDGRLVLNARGAPDKKGDSAQAPRTVAFSRDGGASWTKPEVDDRLPRYQETHSGLLRIPAAKGSASARSSYLFSYPSGPGRRDGKILLSTDEQKTWPVQKLIVPGSFGYSNLDQLADGSFVLIYEAGGANVALVRFTLDWLRTGDAAAPLAK